MTNLFDGVQTITSESPAAMKRFPEYFTSFTRYYGFTREVLSKVIYDSLVRLTEPAHMFRGDHARVRILREFTSQTLGNTLITFLKPLVAMLSAELLSEASIIESTEAILERLYRFRFPLEFKSGYITIGQEIAKKFPGYETMGVSGIFFLRYLCPLILNSPECFHAEPTVIYRTNSLRIVKLVQQIANSVRTDPSDLASAIDNSLQTKQHAQICAFLSRLSCPIDESGIVVPASFLTCTTMPSTESLLEFFTMLELIADHLTTERKSLALQGTVISLQKFREFLAQSHAIILDLRETAPIQHLPNGDPRADSTSVPPPSSMRSSSSFSISVLRFKSRSSGELPTNIQPDSSSSVRTHPVSNKAIPSCSTSRSTSSSASPPRLKRAFDRLPAMVQLRSSTSTSSLTFQPLEHRASASRSNLQLDIKGQKCSVFPSPLQRR